MDKPTLAEQVYYQIKEKILQGDYPMGSALNEVEIANQLGVSRTPVREALRRLEKDMLVDHQASRGVSVIELSLHDIIEIMTLREVLEGLAARQATKWATDEELHALRDSFPKLKSPISQEQLKLAYQAGEEMHKFIMQKSRNQRLVAITESIFHQTKMLTELNAIIPGRHLKAYREHMAVVNAMVARDELRAERAMRKHIQLVLLSILEYQRFE